MRNIPINRPIAPGTTIPGASLGVTDMRQVHEFNGRQLRRKGFTVRTGQGANTLKIELPGTARLLLGLNVLDMSGDPANVCNFIINNDSRIEQTSLNSISRVVLNPVGLGMAFANALGCSEYFELLALLSGNDSITMEMTITTAAPVYVTIYYI